jgi:hypothetical protein
MVGRKEYEKKRSRIGEVLGLYRYMSGCTGVNHEKTLTRIESALSKFQLGTYPK